MKNPLKYRDKYSGRYCEGHPCTTLTPMSILQYPVQIPG